MRSPIRRRDFLRSGAVAAGALAFGPSFWRGALAAAATVGESPYGPLGLPDINGLSLPDGFTSREIARAGVPVENTTYAWHPGPDGQATYAVEGGDFVLVSNSETLFTTGGVSAIRFAGDGTIRSAYRICGGTNVNCSGGPTPWGTWLTCEEFTGGQVWECDPLGAQSAVNRPALGVFNHEAAAVDPVHGTVYLTEDEGDGCLYRFTPTSYPDLGAGLLEVALVDPGNRVTWAPVPDPSAIAGRTRKQVPGAATFRGGEGIWFDSGVIYFATKGDHSLWSYDTGASTLERIYDPATSGNADFLRGPDNLTVARSGDIFVCEDNGQDEFDVVLVTPERVVAPFVRASGPIHDGSEFAGVTFSPDGERMFFASQRGHGAGAVYEVTGPFRPGKPAPPGEPDPPLTPGTGNPGTSVPTIEDVDAPGISIQVRRRVSLAALRRDGLTVTVRVDEDAQLAVALRTSQLATTPGKRGSSQRPLLTVLGRRTRRAGAGRVQVQVPLRAAEARRLEAALKRHRRRGAKAQIRARVTVQAKDAAGNVAVANRAVTITLPARRAA